MVSIKVTPADEDEVVVAGVVGTGASGPASEPELALVPQLSPGSAAEPRPSSDPASEPQPAPFRERTPKADGAREGGRRETTLEDLEPQAMPLAQRIVIIAAVVCIIGALVYYFMVMR